MAVNLRAPESLAAVAGVKLRAAATGLRYQGRDDLLLIHIAEGSNTSAVFTQNHFAAAPVRVAQSHLSTTQPQALLINMGNANAATGHLGEQNCIESCEYLAKHLDIDLHAVLPFSTGVIGEHLDMPKLRGAIDQLLKGNETTDWVRAASAIMTTDTISKGGTRQFELGGKPVTITGITKGAGMIAPNMATMLAFIATDACIEADLLNQILGQSVEKSFNRISVDSDTSTNDAVTLTATGRGEARALTSFSDEHAHVFCQELEGLMVELATSIVRDGEGASKFVKVEVVGGRSKANCKAVAEAVGNSPLIKTALYASDPNWGRFPMAIGKANLDQLNPEKVDLSVNGLAIMQSGAPHPEYSEGSGQAVFAESELCIVINLNQGNENYHIWTTDLGHDYVKINADYRS